MKKLIAVAVMSVASLAAGAQTSVPEIPFHADTNYLKMPKDMYLGEVAGVAVNSKRHIFILSRGNTTGPAYGAAATQLLEFGPDGNYLREIGHNLYAWSYGHAVKIDKQDNIWVADKGSDMVIKFSPEGKVLMVFGRKQEASDDGTGPLSHVFPPLAAVDGLFRQVTDMAWDNEGNTYISDGYINSRVAKVDKDGNWLKQWGSMGNGPGQFFQPHSLATDAQGNVYVADRGNRRIQVFDTDGKYLREIHMDVPLEPGMKPWLGPNPPANPPYVKELHGDAKPPVNHLMQPGSPWTVCITPGPKQVLFASDGFPGRIYKMTLDGKLLGVYGRSGHTAGEFGWIHEIACPSENELFVAELLNWRVQRLTLSSK